MWQWGYRQQAVFKVTADQDSVSHLEVWNHWRGCCCLFWLRKDRDWLAEHGWSSNTSVVSLKCTLPRLVLVIRLWKVFVWTTSNHIYEIKGHVWHAETAVPPRFTRQIASVHLRHVNGFCLHYYFTLQNNLVSSKPLNSASSVAVFFLYDNRTIQ